MSIRHRYFAATGLALLLAACSSSAEKADPTTVASTAAVASTTSIGIPTSTKGQSAPTSAPADGGAISAAPGAISAERCEQNKAAGKISFLTGFDFAAAASIIDVIVAEENGYFKALCLDVDIKSSFSTANYPLVAANEAQFASGGSYIELLNNSGGGADLRTVVLYGRTAIEGLVIPKDKAIASLADLKGKNIGIKGALPPSMVALLAASGLVEGTDYQETLLDGFDPVAHLATGIDALPVFRSNEPGQLDRAGIKYDLYAAENIPGSFGLIFTNAKFAADHPTAVEDFVRADLAGWAAAVADPKAAVAAAVKRIDAAGNPNYLNPDGEGFRFTTEAKIVADATPAGTGEGIIDPKQLQAQVDAYLKAGVLKGNVSIDNTYLIDPALKAYTPGGAIIPIPSK
jgi:ABC-type nitrate/sulfonate/bicarbonate transport system substrate-binding protein